MPEGFAGSRVAEQAVGTEVDEVKVLVFLASITCAVARLAIQEMARIVESILRMIALDVNDLSFAVFYVSQNGNSNVRTSQIL